jgi:hypothetical protein
LASDRQPKCREGRRARFIAQKILPVVNTDLRSKSETKGGDFFAKTRRANGTKGSADLAD